MALIFHTQNLNKRLYRNMTWNVLYHLGQFPYEFLKKWDIHLWSLEDTNPQFFEHINTTSGQKINPNMPSGVTGKYRIDLWLHDVNNEFMDRENSDRLQHEICHAVLYGTPEFVSGVHDAVRANKHFKISFWYWNRFWWKRFYLSILDIRELI